MSDFDKLNETSLFRIIRQWKNMWNYEVAEKLRSMKVIAGEGITINEHPSGVVISAIRRPSGGSGSQKYKGPFAVELKQDGSIETETGWLNRNGVSAVSVGKLTMAAASVATGELCICSEIVQQESGTYEWTPPSLKIKTAPDVFAFPIAKIVKDQQTGNVTVTQYHCPIAFIVASKVCPMAKLAE